MKLTKAQQELVDKIIEGLSTLTLPWEQPWSAQEFPKNGMTHRYYQGSNLIALHLKSCEKGYRDNRWFTYLQAKQCGGNLRRGEKGTAITLFKWWDKEKGCVVESSETSHNEIEITDEYLYKKCKRIYRDFVVFNAEQIENLKKCPINKEEISSEERKVEELLKRYSILVLPHLTHAFYTVKSDTIYLPSKEQFKTYASYCGTLFHEMIHSTGHPKRLNRAMSFKFATVEYAKEEFIAEMGSLLLRAELGIPGTAKSINNSKAYLKSWYQLFSDSPYLLFQLIHESERAVHFIQRGGRDILLPLENTTRLIHEIF